MNRVVIANFREGTKIFPKGRKVYVISMPGLPDYVEIWAQSRGGRWVRAWVRTLHLENARVRNIPEEAPPAKHFSGYHGRIPERVVELINDQESIREIL